MLLIFMFPYLEFFLAFLSISIYSNPTNSSGYFIFVMHFANCREYKKREGEYKEKKKKKKTHSPYFLLSS